MAHDLMYIELKTGYSDDGPAWIGYVKASKSGKTLYFNDHAFQNAEGHIPITEILKAERRIGFPA